MSDHIEHYLEQLKTQLAGADRATIQDALSDAEEHLRTAFTQSRRDHPDTDESSVSQTVIEEFGSPEDVAAAYREMELRAGPVLAARPPAAAAKREANGERSFSSRFFGVFVDPRAYAALFYMLTSLITGVLYFTWATTGISLSLGLIVLIIGLPFILVFLLSIQGIALVEGRVVEALLGVRMPRRPIFSSPHLGFWGRLRALVSDKLSWTTLLYMVVQLPLGILYFTVFITMLSLGLAGIAYPVVRIFADVPVMQFGEYQFFPPMWFYPIVVLVGAVWILVTLHLALLAGRAHGALAKLLLVRD
jgi:hypothetical protein